MRAPFIIAATVWAAVMLSIAIASPRPSKKAPEKKEELKKDTVPELPTGETNWGRLTQAGKNFELSGHPNWDGRGFIREDGKIQILWTWKATGEACPGVYDFVDGLLVGAWGHGSDVRFDDRGNLERIDPGNQSAIMPDTVRPVPPPMPDF